MDLEQFANEFQEQLAPAEDEVNTPEAGEERFTLTMIDYLVEAGEIDEGVLCCHRSSGARVSGYQLNSELECIDLLIALPTGAVPPPSVPKSQIDKHIGWLSGFLTKSLAGIHTKLEQNDPGFDLAFQIFAERDSLTKARFFVLTDGIANTDGLTPIQVGPLEATVHIWDIVRLHRFDTSGGQREAIEIIFSALSQEPIICLERDEPAGGYRTLLTVFSGQLLFDIYSRYGPRLLEKNVRAFLQAKGGVNKGIRETINANPEMFFAYNNGISATADSIQCESISGAVVQLVGASGFQIVNGGQTTASIFHAAKRDKADISKVQVQVKLTVPHEREKMDEIVPLISRYANTQNKVNLPDLLANHPFHLKLEALSRTIWAPPKPGAARQMRWFYERARGQYLDEKARQETPRQRRIFEQDHPPAQKFTKTDVAKFENTWDQRPHMVSRGAQKNFVEFTEILAKRGVFEPDERYFQHLIAKAIIFKAAERLVQQKNYGGYRAQVVTLTLAWLFNRTAQRVDLGLIWRKQAISDALAKIITDISADAHQHILGAPGGANLSEWAKKEACWTSFKDREIAFSPEKCPELGDANTSTERPSVATGISTASEEEQQLIEEVARRGAGYWQALKNWSWETDNLEVWQRGIVKSVAAVVAYGRKPSVKQAVQAAKIMTEAERLGFKGIPGAAEQ